MAPVRSYIFPSQFWLDFMFEIFQKSQVIISPKFQNYFSNDSTNRYPSLPKMNPRWSPGGSIPPLLWDALQPHHRGVDWTPIGGCSQATYHGFLRWVGEGQPSHGQGQWGGAADRTGALANLASCRLVASNYPNCWPFGDGNFQWLNY